MNWGKGKKNGHFRWKNVSSIGLRERNQPFQEVVAAREDKLVTLQTFFFFLSLWNKPTKWLHSLQYHLIAGTHLSSSMLCLLMNIDCPRVPSSLPLVLRKGSHKRSPRGAEARAQLINTCCADRNTHTKC